MFGSGVAFRGLDGGEHGGLGCTTLQYLAGILSTPRILKSYDSLHRICYPPTTLSDVAVQSKRTLIVDSYFDLL